MENLSEQMHFFIGASQGFEKVGNQNCLRPEHVEFIK